MSDINVTVTGSKRLKLAGKFCDKDVVVTALGGETDIKIQYNKTVTPSKTKVQDVGPDSGYNFLGNLIVNKIPDEYIQPTETMDIDENGTYDVTACKTVNVRVAGSVDLICSVGDTFFSDAFLEGYDINWDTMDCSVTPSGILSATLESDYYSFEALAEGSATIHFAFLEYSGDETIYVDVSVEVTAKGSGSEDLNAVLAEQESLIAELKTLLASKATAGSSKPIAKALIRRGIGYIDTGIDGANSNLKIEIQYELLTLPTGYGTLIRAYANESTNSTRIIFNKATHTYCCLNSVPSASLILEQTRYVGVVYTDVLGPASGTNFAYNSNGEANSRARVGGDTLAGKNLTLFANSASDDGINIKVYYLKIYNGNTLLRDFVPYINSSGESGLYDKVTRQFYGNSGDGTFEAETMEVIE